MTSKRYKELDVARGMGIILVAAGHALRQTQSLATPVQLMISVIYSFHMPLFFILSGFVAIGILRLETRQDILRYAADRAKRLLVPYAVMSLLYLPLKVFMSRYSIKPYEISSAWRILIGDSPNTVVWFLFILFFCSVLAAAIVRPANLRLVLSGAFLVSGVAYALDWQLKLPRYFFFFMLGLWLRDNYEGWDEVLQKPAAILLSSVMFVGGNYALWRYGGLWAMLTALTGSHLTLAAARLITDQGRKNRPKLLEKLGLYSMDIYIFSEPVMTVVRLVLWDKLQLPAWPCILLCFICGLFVSLAMSLLVIRRVPVFRRLFLGVR